MSAQHTITHATWLGDGLLLAVASLPAAKSARVAWRKAKDVRHARSAIHELPGGETAWLVWTRHNATRAQQEHRLEFIAGRESVTVRIADIPCRDLKTLARECFTALSAQERAGLLQFLSRASEADTRVACNLYTLRETLRERLVESVISSEIKQSIHVEQIYALSDGAFFIRGWFSDIEASATHLRVCSPEGAQIELLHHIHRYPRPDIARHYGLAGDTQQFGFMAEFESPAPSIMPRGWIAELHARGVESLEAAIPAPVNDPEQIQNSLLALLPSHGCGELLEKHIHPAISRLALRQRTEAGIASIEQFGEAPACPAASILIILESNGELVEHQLAQFANDPASRSADILFVLCNPAAAGSLAASMSRFHRCYAIPFRLAVPTAPLTKSHAQNIAAAHASAPVLVFLSSSVFPAHSGWLAALLAANPHGAAGAKLLREDDSIAHAGIRMVKNGNAWQPRSRFRGLQRHLPDACVAGDVPALSAACFAISRKLFDAVGGFSATFATHQLEEADFFLRLTAAGVTNRYAPDAEAYHLPVLKKPAPVSEGASLYDAWLFERAHGTLLSKNDD